MKRFTAILSASVLLLMAQSAMSACPGVLDHKMKNLDGEPLDLCTFAGKVVLAVNTASYCGNTPQYKGLQALYDKYRNQGLVVIGFPANDFGSQEPGTSAEIKDFCELTYGVEFPMVEKTSVVAEQANPVFAELARMTNDTPEWNFHKYLVSRDGKRAFSYPARMKPQDPKIVTRIEALLEE
ncbi:MAG: glutathione peroxidase [Betaproteobacteria bacterium]|jgi:glutathione peroxidase|nr:MAG: glutathione peroxidase [Betaproteobacteria bacterium]